MKDFIDFDSSIFVRLYLCKKIIMSFGGTLTCRKRIDHSEGSTFEIEMPNNDVVEAESVSLNDIQIE